MLQHVVPELVRDHPTPNVGSGQPLGKQNARALLAHDQLCARAASTLRRLDLHHSDSMPVRTCLDHYVLEWLRSFNVPIPDSTGLTFSTDSRIPALRSTTSADHGRSIRSSRSAKSGRRVARA